MVGLIKSGMWIPLVIFLVMFAYALTLFFRHLTRYRNGDMGGGSELSDSFLVNLVEIELIKEGEALLEKGSHEQAAAVLEKSVNKNSGLPLTHYLLGKAYLGLEDNGRALDSFNKFIEMATNYDETQQNRISDAKGHIHELQRDKKLS